MAKIIRLTAKNGTIKEVPLGARIKLDPQFIGAKVEMIDSASGARVPAVKSHVVGKDIVLTYVEDGKEQQVAVEGAAPADTSAAQGSTSDQASGDAAAQPAAPAPAAASSDDDSDDRSGGGLSGGAIGLGFVGLGALGGLVAAAGGGGGGGGSTPAPTDTTAPTATISLSDTALAVGETATVTITFSEAVSGFTNADLVVQGGLLSNVASSDGGRTWTATFTPEVGLSDATNVITLSTGYTDAAGNAGTAATSANYAIDTLTFTVTQTGNTLNFGGTATGPITITLNAANQAIFSRSGETASTIVETISTKVLDVPQNGTLNLVLDPGATADTFTVNAPNAATINVTGNGGLESDTLAIIVESATGGPDLRTMTVNTSGLTGVEAIKFVFPDDARDVVKLTADSVLTGFSTIEVSKGGVDLTAVTVTPGTEFIVNSTLIVTLDQFKAMTSLVSVTGLGHLTINLTPGEVLSGALNTFLTNPSTDKPILIGTTVTVINTGNSQTVPTPPAMDAISFEGIPGLSAAIDDLQAQIDALGDGGTEITSQILEITTLLDSLSASLLALSDDFSTHSLAETQALADLQDALDAAVADLGSRIDTLTSTLQGQIDDLQNQIDDNTSDITALTGRASDLEDALAALIETVADNNTAQSEALADAQTALELAIADLTTSLQEQIDDLQSQIDANGGDIADLADRATALEDALAALTATVADNNTAQSEALAAAQTALEDAIADLSSSVQADIDNLQAQIDAINDDATLQDPATLNSIAGLRAALEALQTAVGDSSVFDQISEAIGHESDPEANPPVTATGLFADIERLIYAAATDINARIDQLVDDSAANGGVATLDSITGLKEALQGVLNGENLGDPTDPSSLAGKLAGMLDRIETLENGLDTTAPYIVETQIVSATGADANGHLNAGDVVTMTVKFSESVLVTGHPVLELLITDGEGGGVVEAAMTGGAGTDTLTFTYTISADDVNDFNGISIEANGLVGGTIKDAAGNQADREFDAVGGDGNFIVDTGPLDLTMSAGAIFGSGMNADNVIVAFTPMGPVTASQLDANGQFQLPSELPMLSADDYIRVFLFGDGSYWANEIVGPATVPFDFANMLAWDTGEGFFVVTTEETLRDFVVTPFGQGMLEYLGYSSIEDYIAGSTMPASDVAYNDGAHAGEVFSDSFLQSLTGHDIGDITLTVSSPLTLAQAAKLAAAGFDLAHNVNYEIRDWDTTIQAAMLNPESAASVRGADQVIAAGDELSNFMRFTSFDASVNLRMEAMAGDDRIDTGRGDEEIVGGLGGDTINLTYNDTSADEIVYQTAFDGRALPLVSVSFTVDGDYYREGTTVSVVINGHIYTYTMTADDTSVLDALNNLADVIGTANGLLSDVRIGFTDIDGDLTSAQLLIYGAKPTTVLDVQSGAYDDYGLLDISNPGMVTLIDVNFPGSSSDYPATTNGDNTTEFSRHISITIEGVTVWADVVEGDPHASVVALAEAINAARLEDTTDGQTLYDAIGAIDTTNDISGSTLTLHGAAVPEVGNGPTFSVDEALVDVPGVQQETEVTFSANNADYYAGGKLSVTIDGVTIEADMVAGDAEASQQNLVNAINVAVNGTTRDVAAEVTLTPDENFGSTPFDTPAPELWCYNFYVRVESAGSQVAYFYENSNGSPSYTGATAVTDFVAAVNAALVGHATASIDASGNFVVTTTELGADAYVIVGGGATTGQSNGASFNVTSEIGDYFVGPISVDSHGSQVPVPPIAAIAALVEDAVIRREVLNSVYEGLDYVSWDAPGGGTTRDLDEASFNAKLANYGEFTMPFVKLNDFIIANSAYDVSGYPDAAVAIVDTVYTSLADWAADASAKFSQITGQNITVSYDPDNGNISFGGFGYPYNFSGGTFAFAAFVPHIVLTAATEEPDPLGATGALGYQGELQHATIELNDAASYDVYADGITDTTRDSSVYYSGGKAYLTISAVDADGNPDPSHSTTVSVDMAAGNSITYVMGSSAPDIGADWPMVTPWGNDAGFTITFTVDGVVYDRADLEAYLADQSKFVGTVDTYNDPGAATAGDIANWISSLPGVGTATVAGKGWTITAEGGHDISISTTGFGLDNGSYYYGFNQEAGPSAEALTSQALVDEINRLVAHVPTLTLAGDYAPDDALNLEGGRVFGFDIDTNGDGIADYGFALWNSDPSFYANSYYNGGIDAGSQSSITSSSVPATIGDLLARIAGLPVVDTATINADGDIVLTFTTEGSINVTNISQIQPYTFNLGAGDIDSYFVPSMAIDPDLADLIGHAAYDAQTGQITLTAAQYGKETFEVSDITLDYQGVHQLATLTLDERSYYGETFTDGSSTDDAQYDRGAAIYYQGGKVYVTITPTGGEAVTISTDMVASAPLRIIGDLQQDILATNPLSGGGLTFFDGTTEVQVIPDNQGTVADFLAKVLQEVPFIASAELVNGNIVITAQDTVTNLPYWGEVTIGSDTLFGGLQLAYAEDYSTLTTQALVDAINAETGVGGLLEGVIGVATRDGNTITLEAAQAGHETFTVSDVALDYQGTNQIATADYSTWDSDYYAGGTLSVTVDTTPDLDDGIDGDVTITVDMVDDDAQASITALHDAILNKITAGGALTVTLPASFALPGTFDLSDQLYLSSQRVFGINIDTDGDGNTDHGFSLWNSGGGLAGWSYYSGGAGSGVSGEGSGSSIPLGTAGIPQTIGELLTRIAALPVVDTATINADGDIVLTLSSTDFIQLAASATVTGATLLMGEGYAPHALEDFIVSTGANANYDAALAAVLSDVTMDSNGTITLTSKDHTEHQFDIADATITERPEYQEATATFSDNNADYYAGGKIGIDVNGTTIEVDMVAGDAALTVANLVNAITAANQTQIVIDKLADLALNDLLSNGWEVSSGGITIDANTAGINNGNDVQALLQALEMLPDVDSAVIVDGNIVITAKAGVDALTIGVSESDLGVGGDYTAPTTSLSGDLQDVWSNGTTITLMAAHDVDGYGEINITDVHMGVAAQVQVTEVDLGEVDFEVGRMADNLPANSLSVGGETITGASGSGDADSVRNLAQAIIEARDGVIAEDVGESAVGTAPGNDVVITVDPDFVSDFDILVSGGVPSSSYMGTNLVFFDGSGNGHQFDAFVTPTGTGVYGLGWSANYLPTSFSFAGYVDALNNALTAYENLVSIELGTISYDAISHKITYDVADGFSAALIPQTDIFGAMGDNGEDSVQIAVTDTGAVTGNQHFVQTSLYDSTTVATDQGGSNGPALLLSLFSEAPIRAVDSLTSDIVTGTLTINGQDVTISFTPTLDETGIGSGSKISDLIASLSDQLTGYATVELFNGQIAIIPVQPDTGLPTIDGSVTFAVEDASRDIVVQTGSYANGGAAEPAVLNMNEFAFMATSDRLVDGHITYSFDYTDANSNTVTLAGAFDASNSTLADLLVYLEDNFPEFTVALTEQGIALTSADTGSAVQLSVNQFGFEVYREADGVLSNVVSIVDYNESMGITLTGANAGIDQMNVGDFNYQVEDTVNSVKQEVVVTFSNAVLDHVAEGTVVSVRVAGIESSYTVTAEDAALGASSRSETIVEKLALQVALDHDLAGTDPNVGSVLGSVEQGRLTYDLETGAPVFTVPTPPYAVNANSLHFTANVTGANLLGVATDDSSIYIRVVYPNQTTEGQPGIALETVAGSLVFTDGTDPDYIYAYTGQTDVSHTGRVEGVLHYDENPGGDGEVHSNDYTLVDMNGEDMSIYVGEGGTVGEFDVYHNYGWWNGYEGILNADDQAWAGDSEDLLTQDIVNPGEDSSFYGDSPLIGLGEGGSLNGVDQIRVNPGDGQDSSTNPNFYGDNASTGAAGGVEQTHTNPDNGYVADNTPAAAGGEDSSGDGNLFGSNAGQYEDDGLHTSWLNNAAGTDGLYTDDAGGNDLTHLIDIGDGSNYGDGGLSGQYETQYTDGEDSYDGFNIALIRDGYAPFEWDNAIRNVQSTGNATWDVINNFQVGHDVIALEGALQNTTADGDIDRIEGNVTYDYNTFWPEVNGGGFVAVNGHNPQPTEWQIELGLASANDGFEINRVYQYDWDGTPYNMLFVNWTPGIDYYGVVALPATSTYFSSVDDFISYLNNNLVDVVGSNSETIYGEYDAQTGILSVHMGAVSNDGADYWLSSESFDDRFVSNVEIPVKQAFDLSTNEFGLVGSALNGEQGSDQLDTITLANYGGGTDVVWSDDYSIGRSSVTISVDGGLTTHTYRIGTLETIQDLVDVINEGGLVHAAIGEEGSAPFTLTETVVGQELSATFNLNMAWNTGDLNWNVMASDHSTATTGHQTDVLVSELTDASAISDLLNSTFDFGNTYDNGEINTSIFAVTAADDATQTAIWAHRQSWSGDDTIDPLELTLLGVVHTTGDEFNLQNLAMLNSYGPMPV